MTEQKEKLKIPYKMGIGPEGIMTEEQFKEMQAKKAKGDYTDLAGNPLDAPLMTLTPEQFAKLDKIQEQMKLKQQHEKKMDKIDKSRKVKAKKLEKMRTQVAMKAHNKEKKPLPPKLKSLDTTDTTDS